MKTYPINLHPRPRPRAWQGKVFHTVTGKFLLRLSTTAPDLRTAEEHLLSRACLALRCGPLEIDLRRVNETRFTSLPAAPLPQ